MGRRDSQSARRLAGTASWRRSAWRGPFTETGRRPPRTRVKTPRIGGTAEGSRQPEDKGAGHPAGTRDRRHCRGHGPPGQSKRTPPRRHRKLAALLLALAVRRVRAQTTLQTPRISADWRNCRRQQAAGRARRRPPCRYQRSPALQVTQCPTRQRKHMWHFVATCGKTVGTMGWSVNNARTARTAHAWSTNQHIKRSAHSLRKSSHRAACGACANGCRASGSAGPANTPTEKTARRLRPNLSSKRDAAWISELTPEASFPKASSLGKFPSVGELSPSRGEHGGNADRLQQQMPLMGVPWMLQACCLRERRLSDSLPQ